MYIPGVPIKAEFIEQNRTEQNMAIFNITL